MMDKDTKPVFKVSTSSRTYTVTADKEETVLEALRRHTGLAPQASCGGRGRCGQCRIYLLPTGSESPGPESFPPLDQVETELLTETEVKAGLRLGCRLRVYDGMQLRLVEQGPARIETRVEGLEEESDPILTRTSVILPAGSLADQRPAAARLEAALEIEPGSLPASLARTLQAIPDGRTPLSVILEEGRPVALDIGELTENTLWAAAVDIGTTTVAMYLVNLSDGKVAESRAELNAQAPYGADVISRLEHARKGEEEALEIQRVIVNQLKQMLSALALKHGVKSRDLHLLAVAGNTAMLHLMAGWDATGLGEAPFLPTVLESPAFQAADIGLSGFSRLRIWPLPSLSAYVGADITAGILSSGMWYGKGTDLLLDIGTNGEMALGGADGLICCSTAAGPAFEGAHLSSGSGSVPGAVDHVDWLDSRMTFSTIEGAPAAGFCGSGVVDLVAFLVNSGLMDDTGRIAESLAEDSEDAYGGMNIVSGKTGPELRWNGTAYSGGNLGFTQKDLREVQLAKAAIRAGIDTLLIHAGKTVDDIGTLWLAGGFGSYIRPESAAAIGLIPAELADKSRSLGNAAARGALLCLLSGTRRREALEITRNAQAIELSGRPDFQDAYIEGMMFSCPGSA